MSTQVRSFIRFFFEVGVFFLATALAFVFFTAVYPLGDGEGLTAIYPYAAAFFVGGIIYMMAYMIGGGEGKDIERGERLVPTWKVKLLSWWKTLGDPHPFFWAGLWYPFVSGVMSLAAVGAPGSGKTVIIRLFLQSILPKIGIVPDHRALLYDAKGDYLPILAGMGIDVSEERGLVKTLHPFDLRAWSWELWLDLKDFRSIDEIVVIFIPVQGGNDDHGFWSSSARSLLKGVFKALIESGKPWTLYDVCTYMRSFDRMRQLIEDTPETRHLIEKILEKGKTSDGIDVTLYSYMERYEVIAAIWNKIPKERRISLTEWLNDPDGSILLLGRGARGTAHDAINQLIIDRLGQLITIYQEDSSTRRTWVVFDEIRQSGRLNLDPIATMGRSKGAVLAIGYQDQSGLQDAYNKEIADELLGMCQHKTFFYLGTAQTAHYAAEQIGKQEYKDESGAIKERYVVLPSQFTSRAYIPETNRRNGCTFYAKSATFGAYKMRLRGRRLFVKLLRPLDKSVKGFEARPASDQRFTETIALPENETLELEQQKRLEIEYVPQEVQNVKDEARETAEAIKELRKRRSAAKERSDGRER